MEGLKERVKGSMNIGILEIFGHKPPLAELCRIANSEDHQVNVFTTQEIFERLKQDFNLDVTDYEWELKNEGESNYSYLKRVEKICNKKIDTLIVQTIPPSFAFSYPFAFFNPDCKKLLVTHNINSWFKYEFQLNLLYLNFLQVMSYNLSLILRKVVLPKYDSIIVLYAPIKDYVENELGYEKVFCLPDTIYQDPEQLNDGNKIHFTFPGGVQLNKRGGKRILEVFSDIFEEFGNVKLEFLGKIDEDKKYERGILEKCKSLEREGYNIKYYTKWIPQEKYEKRFLKSDVMLLGIDPDTEREFVGEIYGTTKTSGTIGDCMKYGKPLIASDEFRVAEELESSFLTYKNKGEYKAIIESLIKNREKLRNLQKEAIKNSKRFTLERQRERFNKIINES